MTRETQGKLYSQTEEQAYYTHRFSELHQATLGSTSLRTTKADNTEGHIDGAISILEKFSAFFEMKDTCVWCI